MNLNEVMISGHILEDAVFFQWAMDESYLTFSVSCEAVNGAFFSVPVCAKGALAASGCHQLLSGVMILAFGHLVGIHDRLWVQLDAYRLL